MPTTRSQTRRLFGIPGPDVRPASHHENGDTNTIASDEPIHMIEVLSRPPSIIPHQSKPPVFKINLSLPPSQRYVEVATAYQEKLRDLTAIFDDLLEQAGLPRKPLTLLAKLILRRLYSKEQTEELRGIRKVTGVGIHLLVALNVLLDLFMGCTSGGVRVTEGRRKKMLHFRSLDWSMDELRDVLVQFEFVEQDGGEVVARAINYVGFVGVLTGVRQGLSVSLNFRPYHNNDKSALSNIKFRLHQLLVLLGFRPSLPSLLRDLIIPCSPSLSSPSPLSHQRKPLPDLAAIAEHFPSIPTTCAYLVFNDGTHTIVMEKDRVTALLRSSSSFITVTNHDGIEELRESPASAPARHRKTEHMGIQMSEILDESIERKGEMVRKWEGWCEKAKKRAARKVASEARREPSFCLTRQVLVDWVEDFPIANEMTHFSTVMDPTMGEFVWVRVWPVWGEDSDASIGEDSDADGNSVVEASRTDWMAVNGN